MWQIGSVKDFMRNIFSCKGKNCENISWFSKQKNYSTKNREIVFKIYQISRKEHKIFWKMPIVPYKFTHFVFWNPLRTRFITLLWPKKVGINRVWGLIGVWKIRGFSLCSQRNPERRLGSPKISSGSHLRFTRVKICERNLCILQLSYFIGYFSE